MPNPALCTDLGGTLREVEGEWVCQNLDHTGTFCIVGSADAFPCRGLFRHVIQCNDAYNRPALNPFMCDIVCKAPGAPWEVKARGPNCELVQTPDEILPETGRTINLPNFPDGYTGVLATLQVLAPNFVQGNTPDDFVLINHRPLGPGVEDPQIADQLTIAAGNVLRIPEYAPLQADETSRMLVAKNSCPDPVLKGAANLHCYPVFVTIVANFQTVSDAALAAEVAKDAPDLARIADLAKNHGANVNQANYDGEALLLQAARAGKHLAVSVLITLGADPYARSPGNNRQVPHWATFYAQLEVLRHYISAIGQRGHAYDWNNADRNGYTPLDWVQERQGLVHCGRWRR